MYTLQPSLSYFSKQTLPSSMRKWWGSSLCQPGRRWNSPLFKFKSCLYSRSCQGKPFRYISIIYLASIAIIYAPSQWLCAMVYQALITLLKIAVTFIILRREIHMIYSRKEPLKKNYSVLRTCSLKFIIFL